MQFVGCMYVDNFTEPTGGLKAIHMASSIFLLLLFFEMAEWY